jgi:long-subunit acyl-CoA synthetase (AMP-forming)
VRASDGAAARRRAGPTATAARLDVPSSSPVEHPPTGTRAATGRRSRSGLPASLGSVLAWRAARTPLGSAFRVITGDDVITLSWDQTLRAVDEIAAGLLALGVQPEQVVAIASPARLDPVLTELAVARAGAASVAARAASDDLALVLRDCAACVVVAGGSAELAAVGELWPTLPDLQVVVALDASAVGPGSPYAGDRRVISLDDVRGRGRALLAEEPTVVGRRAAAVTSDQVAALVYPAGAPGRPEGIRLTHRDRLAQASTVTAAETLTQRDLQYTWHPVPPPLSGALLAAQLVVGFSAAVGGDVELRGAPARQIRPTFVVATPYACERLRSRWPAQPAVTGTSRSRASARAPDLTWPSGPSTGRRRRVWVTVRHAAAQMAGLRRLRGWLGGRVRFVLCGGAPLDAQVVGWFQTIGVPVLAADGLLGPPGGERPWVDAQVADRITLADGSVVDPWPVEQALKAECPWVSHVVVCGDGRPYPCALVALDPDDLVTWAQLNGMAGEASADVARSAQVRLLVAAGLGRVNEGRAARGRPLVRRFAVLPTDLSAESGELTATHEVRRAAVRQRYGDLLDSLYD